MNREYLTPKCCGKFLKLKNSMGYSSPYYFTFQCNKCGKIMVVDADGLDRFALEVEDE